MCSVDASSASRMLGLLGSVTYDEALRSGSSVASMDSADVEEHLWERG
jgi:hypothetical protein